MKLIFSINDPNFFLSHRLPLAEELIKQDNEVFLLSDFSAFDKSIFEKKKIKPINIKFERSSISLIANLKLIVDLIKVYKKFNPDIIHHITLKFYLFGTLSTFLIRNKIKVVNAVTGLGYLYVGERNHFVRLIINSLLRIIVLKKDCIYIFQNRIDILR